MQNLAFRWLNSISSEDNLHAQVAQCTLTSWGSSSGLDSHTSWNGRTGWSAHVN